MPRKKLWLDEAEANLVKNMRTYLITNISAEVLAKTIANCEKASTPSITNTLLQSMRIQLITNLFTPDELAGAALFTDMALYLRDQGHQVWVTTTFSYYPAWALKPEDEGTSVRDELFQGIPVRRVGMYVPRHLRERRACSRI
jgi:hypothetical protein